MLLSRHFTATTLLKESLRRSLVERVPLCPWRSSQTTRRTALRDGHLSSRFVNERSSRDEAAMFYSELQLDRASHLRKQPKALAQLAAASDAKLIPWKKAQCLFVEESERYTPVFLTPFSHYEKYLDAAVGHLFVGFEPDSETPIFAGCIADSDAFASQIEKGEWLPLVSIGCRIDRHYAALLATVNGMMEWHMRHLFCGITGTETLSISGGYARQSQTTEDVMFPRIDPAIICLVTQGEYCLLGKKLSWKNSKRYSMLAGYLEVGETLEQAAVREVFEESGVKIDVESLEYISSQPWPFPQSLMVGYIASLPTRTDASATLQEEAEQAASESGIRKDELDHYLGATLPKPVPEPEEMADVRWFHYRYMKEALSDPGTGFQMPGSNAIANQITMKWMARIESEHVEWPGDHFQDVQIDEGRFKYILARLEQGDQSKIVVRGKKDRSYHTNIFEELKFEADAVGLEVTPLGGGRIEHDIAAEDISIYGYSSAFGAAVHHVAAVLCRRNYPFYKRIHISYKGY